MAKLVEQVVHQPEHLHLLAELIGRMQVDEPIGRQLLVLVGIVADEILAADGDEIGADFPSRRYGIIGTPALN